MRANVRHFLDWLGERDPPLVTLGDLQTYLDEWSRRRTSVTCDVPPSGKQPQGVLSLPQESRPLTAPDGRQYLNPTERLTVPRRRRQAIDFLAPEEDLALRFGYATFQEAVPDLASPMGGMRIGEARTLTVVDEDLALGGDPSPGEQDRNPASARSR